MTCDEQALQQAVLLAMKGHTVECIARYVSYPVETVERWASDEWNRRKYFKGRMCEDTWRNVLESMHTLATIMDCPCRAGFDFSRLDAWERGALRFMPTCR